MEIFRILFLVLAVIYLLLAFVFIHISLRYRRGLNASADKIHSLFAGQIALFNIIDNESKKTVANKDDLTKLLDERNFTELNKVVGELERKYQELFQKEALSNVQISTALKGLEENVVLIRNEVYRYNRIVENINVNADSLIFSLFVVILKLKHRTKI